MVFRKYVLLFCILFWSVLCFGQNPIIYSEQKDVFHLHDNMEILVDSSESVSFLEINNNTHFVPYSKSELHTKTNCYWVKFSIDNTGGSPDLLYLNTAYFDTVDTYIQTNNQTLKHHEKSGFLIPRSPFLLNVVRVNLCEIPIPYGVTTYYIRIISKTPLSQGATVVSFSEGFDLLTNKQIQHTFFAFKDYTMLICGAFILMFFFNILLAYRSRASLFFWLALYNLAVCLNYVNAFGVSLSSGLHHNYYFIGLMHFIMPSLLILTYSFFSIYFLKINEQKGYTLKLLHGLNAILVLSILAYCLGYCDTGMTLVTSSSILQFIIIYYTAFKRYPDQKEDVFYFILAMSIMLAFFVNYMLSITIESRNYYLHELLMLAATFIELIIFNCLAISKFENIKKDVHKLVAQKESLLVAQKEIQKNLEKTNKNLIETTTTAISQQQQQNKIINVLNNVDLTNESDSEVALKKAIQQAKLLTNQHTFDKDFLSHFNGVHINFTQNLTAKHPNLSATELKICAYLRMNLTSLDIAKLQGVEKNSINQSRFRMRKKMDLPKGTNLVTYLTSF